jgi:hypothetical protein
MFKVEFEDGKYTFVNDNGIVEILRYGKPWRNESGDKALLCLLQKFEQQQEELESWRKEFMF